MKLKTLRIVLAAAFIAAPFVVQAQAKGPAPAPAAAPAPVNVTPEARAAIKELLEAMNTRDGLAKAFGGIAQSLPPQMGGAMNRQIENYPGLSADQKAKVRDSMNGPFEAAVKEAQGIVTNPKLVDDTYEKMYAIYASHFTTPEVKQLVAFYKSPIGAKSLTLIPQSGAEAMQAGVGSFAPRVNAIIEKTVKTQVDGVLAQSAPAKK